MEEDVKDVARMLIAKWFRECLHDLRKQLGPYAKQLETGNLDATFFELFEDAVDLVKKDMIAQVKERQG